MESLDLKEIFKNIWDKKFLICSIIIVFILIGLIYSFYFVIPKYESYTSLLLVKAEENIDKNNESISQSDINMNQELVSTYSELIKSKNVIKIVKENLKISESEEEIRKNISVSSVKDTAMIEIIVSSKVANNAKIIANEIASVFTIKIKEIYNFNNVYIVDSAEISEVPYNVNHIRDILMFALIGFIISNLYVFLINILDNTVKKEEDIEKDINLIVLGSLPKYNLNKTDDLTKNLELIVNESPKSSISEIFRTIRTNIQFMITQKDLKSILITSTMPSEGKSWISANLAITFAQTGKKIIIVDSDMRKGRQKEIFEIQDDLGLSNYLSGMNKEEKRYLLQEYIKKTDVENLYILQAGNIPPNPSELLGSEKTIDLLEQLKETFDIIIFDGTPSGIVTDSIILSRLVDSTIIVSSYKDTKIELLKKVKRDIENVGGKITGVILNKIPIYLKEYKYVEYYRNNKAELNEMEENKKLI